MLGRLRFSNDVPDHAFCIDEEGGADHAHVFTAIHGFLAPDPIGIKDLLIRIGQQGKWQFVFGNEFLMTGNIIRADPNHGPSLLDQLFVMVPKIAGLYGACGGHILGVEIHKQLLTLEGT